jgi:hypothetical protein
MIIRLCLTYLDNVMNLLQPTAVIAYFRRSESRQMLRRGLQKEGGYLRIWLLSLHVRANRSGCQQTTCSFGRCRQLQQWIQKRQRLLLCAPKTCTSCSLRHGALVDVGGCWIDLFYGLSRPGIFLLRSYYLFNIFIDLLFICTLVDRRREPEYLIIRSRYEYSNDLVRLSVVGVEFTVLTERLVQAIYRSRPLSSQSTVQLKVMQCYCIPCLDIVHKGFSLLLGPRRNALAWRHLTIVEITILTNTAPFRQN